MRRPFIAGNWKMNLNLVSGRALIADIRAKLGGWPPLDLAVCPPAIYLFPMAKAVDGSPIRLGAQNCWHESSGAFTGEVSTAMIKETGARYVVLGHSERRHAIGPRGPDGRVIGESDEMVAAKAKAAMSGGLVPIVCVGETLEERDRGQTEAVLTRQITHGLAGLEPAAPDALVIAYEPVWAIGTGRNATPEQAQEAHHHIRKLLAGRFGASVADGMRVQYGGSVKPENAESLMKCPDVDGALVGGASLKAADFLGIIRGCVRAKGLN